MHAVHLGAAFQQKPVERGVVLVRLAAEKRFDVQAVRARDQPGHGRELVLADQLDQVSARARGLVFDPEPGQDLAKRIRGHASTAARSRRSLMASPYTSSSRSTVR